MSGRLTPVESAIILGIALLLFLFAAGPIWEHAFTPNASILISYLPIPLLVAALLYKKKQLAMSGLAADTIKILLLKFAISALILTAFWAKGRPELSEAPTPVRGPAPTGDAHAIVALRGDPRLKETPTPAPEPSGPKSELNGVVLDQAGKPAALVLVYLGPSPELSGAAPKEAREITVGPAGFKPSVLGVQLRQPIRVKSANAQLHTAQGFQGAAPIFNLPLVSSGPGQELSFLKAVGPVLLRCTVHRSAEPPGLLGVFDHPFFAVTGEDGRFSLSGVPVGARVIFARTAGGDLAQAPVTLRTGAPLELTLQLQFEDSEPKGRSAAEQDR